MSNLELSLDQMMAELTITFPAMWKRHLSEFGASYAGMTGIWTGADSPHVMPDGESIFNTGGEVNDAFGSWLANRGWTCEFIDHGTFALLPLSQLRDQP